MGVMILETLSDWEGDVEDLARLGEQWSAVLQTKDRAELTVRLVRDYSQRGILGRPRRDGKVAIYGWEHLVRLLAARMLLRDGWPLQKIADEFAVLSLAEIRAILPGAHPRHQVPNFQGGTRPQDPALDALNAIRSRKPALSSAEHAQIGKPHHSASKPPIAYRAIMQQELAASMKTLGASGSMVQSRSYTRLEIASGVELNIETARLRSLGRADANAIAQAVLASLLDPVHRKEDKSE
jgi:hypothetical protein